MNRIGKILYRPTENHVGVIYRFGRFNRFVKPDNWVFTLPWFETVSSEAKLDIRTIQISLKDVYTCERIALDVDLKIFYQVDLREVDQERRVQVLRFSTDAAWDEIVYTGMNDIARNSVFVTHTFDELVTPDGRKYLKRALGIELAERVGDFGIMLNPRFGVNIVNLQPNEEFRRALMEESASKALGTAAVTRLGPLLEKFQEQKLEKALYTLFMQIASAVVKSGEMPDVIFPSQSDYSTGGGTHGNGSGSILPAIQGISQPSRKIKSIVGD